MTPTEIESINPDASHLGFFAVYTVHGKIRLINQFDGFHAFLTDLQQMSPSVALRGC